MIDIHLLNSSREENVRGRKEEHCGKEAQHHHLSADRPEVPPQVAGMPTEGVDTFCHKLMSLVLPELNLMIEVATSCHLSAYP
jgi:hypothetical protein